MGSERTCAGTAVEPWRARTVAFLAGMAVLMVELLASRLMAPVYGTNLEVWAALISVTLAALAGGYELGGRLADRRDGERNLLALLLLVASGLLLLLPFVAPGILDFTWDLAGFRGGVLLSALVLLSPPLLLLGASSPFLVRATLVRRESAGATAGSLYAISTVGSVTGALLTAFWLVPGVGLRGSLLAAAMVALLATALLGSGRLRWAALLLGVGSLLLATGRSREPELEAFVLRDDRVSAYGRIQVVDDFANGERLCLLDGSSQTAVGLDDPSMPRSGYSRLLARQFEHVPRRRGRALVLGLGGGVLPPVLARLGFEVDVVEINRQMVEVARDFFALGEPTIHVADGRRFLREAAPATWDLIVMDVAGGGVQPSHLFTREAFAQVKRVLVPDGLLVVNLLMLDAADRSPLGAAVTRTLGTSFSSVRSWNVNPVPFDGVTNLLLWAGPLPPGIAERARLASARPLDLEGGIVLTDDRNPMETWSARVEAAWRRELRDWLPDEIFSSL